MTAVLGGHVFMMHAPVGVASPHVSSARVRLIAQTGPKRGPAFPDTPTLKEAGYDAELKRLDGEIRAIGKLESRT